jgi:hypothetical protein
MRLTGAVLAMFAAFLAIQPLKGIETAATQAARADSTLELADAQLVAILERFDGLVAVVDAVAFPYERWMSDAEYAERALIGALPKGPLLELESTLGQQWAREVKSASFENQFQDVSLAAGPTAEGFVNWGVPGAVILNICLAGAAALCAAFLRYRYSVRAVFASFFIFSTVLFEQGLLGLADACAKSIQLALVAAVVMWLLGMPGQVRPTVVAGTPVQALRRKEVTQ